MKKSSKILSAIIASVVAIFTLQSCESGRSYSELLNDENMAVNRFLVDQWVIPEIPADSVFLTGPEAPYYQLDEDGNIYMQVLDAGSGEKVADDQVVYFRFKRYNLSYYAGDLESTPSEGNQNDMTQTATSFRYQNFTIPSSSQWGTGIQMPLNFLKLGCDVNLIVKSQYGWTSEVSYVIPYLYRIRYYKSQI
ncbi:MAG: DUF4827 family protein [Paramuribaculum sp.]